MKKAYDNWEQVVEYDGKSLVDAEQNNNSVEPENELNVESIDFDGGLNHQLQMPSLPMSVTSEHQINSGMPVGGKRFCFLESQFDGSSSLFCSSLPFSFSFGWRCHIVCCLCLKFNIPIQVSAFMQL